MDAEPLLIYITKFISLTDEEESILISRLNFRKYLKGQYIVQHGDVCRFSSFLTSGCTKTFYIDHDGQEHIMMFSIKDWWSSDLGSFISQLPANYNVQCIEPTEAIQISYENQQKLYDEIPKLDRLFRKILERALVASQNRLVRNLSLTAKERYLFFKEQYPSFEQRIPQYMIASYLGITKEFLSKIKSQIILDQ